MAFSNNISAILLDIEGTTTPVSFVFDVLFPFARNNVESFLHQRGGEAEVQQDLARLKQEYDQETFSSDLPAWETNDPGAAVPYIHYLISIDRKSTGLKALQGKIWNQGYESGELRSQLFSDIKPAFDRWHSAQKDIYIFSSGSVQAQKLIFRYSPEGDLTSYLSGYFDTTTGPKRDVESYRKIANCIGISPTQLLFISDVVAELRPAAEAGLQTLFSSRPGNHSHDSEGFTLITNFNDIVMQ